jgi:hypothetical protein
MKTMTSTERPRSKELMLRDLLEGAIGDWQQLDDLMDQVMAIVDSRNTVVREGAQQGIPIVSMMRGDLKDAWAKYREQLKKDGGIETIRNAALMGRVRGLAQAVATVESPYTRLHSPKREWLENVKKVMEEARRR